MQHHRSAPAACLGIHEVGHPSRDSFLKKYAWLGARGLPCCARRAVQAKGAGYAISQQEELALVAEVAAATGIILDPVCASLGCHALRSSMLCDPIPYPCCAPMAALRYSRLPDEEPPHPHPHPHPPPNRYTGKALHGLVSEMRADPQAWAGRKVLFVHTGGLLGMYDKATQLEPLVQAAERAHRLVLE